MANEKLRFAALLGLLAVGCAGQVGAPTSAKSGSAPEAPAAQPGAGSAAPAPAPSTAAAGDEARASRSAVESEAPADDRPGLGTSWGETRSSHVSSAPFTRENFDQPFAVTNLFYNDADGVRAMARRSGFAHFGDSSFELARGALSVRLLDANGRPLQGLSAGGRNYVVGQDGQRYVIQIQNHTRQRVEAVATVDGLDVVDGRSGSLSKRGYIIGPFATVEIDGFRQNFDEVAAFRFGAVKDSYAAQKGEDRNVGVIGVAFFAEAGSRWSDFEVDRRHDADAFPGGFASPPVRRF